MRFVLLSALAVFFLIPQTDAEARRWRRRSSSNNYYYNTSSNTSSVDNATAQGVANTMASRNRVAHFGGHAGLYEGCGSGWSQDQAYRNCCYSSSGMPTVDVGYAQSSSGMWYCCRRYSKYGNSMVNSSTVVHTPVVIIEE